jgi:uncharacterized phiE125 gp8 family phage protein
MSGLTLFSGPAIEPVSIVETKSQCRIDESEDDGLLAGYLLAARQHVEIYTGRALIQRTFDLKLDFCWPRCSGMLEILLPKPPKVSVTSISYLDTDGATQVLSGSLYQLTERYGSGLIVPAYGQSWPSVRWQHDAITVRYVAGYGATASDVPEPIRQSIMLLAAHYYANREPVVTGTIVNELPMSVRSLLSQYVAEF